MPLTFHLLLASPQSLDSLDAWGSPDGWPSAWSLDSPLWKRARLWGMEAEASLAASASCSGGRIRTTSAAGGALSSGFVDGGVLADGAGAGHALSAGSETGGVTRALPVSPACARSGDGAAFLRVRTAAVHAPAAVRAVFQPCRIRLDSYGATALSGMEAAFLRVRLLAVSGGGHGGADCAMAAKGWQWQAGRGLDSVWAGDSGLPEVFWTGGPSADALWSEIGGPSSLTDAWMTDERSTEVLR